MGVSGSNGGQQGTSGVSIGPQQRFTTTAWHSWPEVLRQLVVIADDAQEQSGLVVQSVGQFPVCIATVTSPTARAEIINVAL